MTSGICNLFQNKKFVKLNDLVDGKSIEDKRAFLKEFYDWVYSEETYAPTNSKTVWSQTLNGVMPEFDRGLEFGCGTGRGVAIAREMEKEVFGIDIADVSHLWFRYGVDEYCQVGDCLNLPYADEEFDFILCTEVMEHIPEEDVDQVLREIYRVASHRVSFTIALEEEEIPIMGHICSHITLKLADWWLDKVLALGFFPEVYNVSETLFIEAVK